MTNMRDKRRKVKYQLKSRQSAQQTGACVSNQHTESSKFPSLKKKKKKNFKFHAIGDTHLMIAYGVKLEVTRNVVPDKKVCWCWGRGIGIIAH